MTNNDIIRRLRYIFDINDASMVSTFGLSGLSVTRAQVSNWLKPEDDSDAELCNDQELAHFLNGLIIKMRGKREGAQPEVETRLTHNMTFKKLKIALNYKSEDILDVMNLADFEMSSHELSAFFRKPGHKHYRKCGDQILRNFLQGLQMKLRPDESQKQTQENSPYKPSQS
ncbi:MAG: DUF1456 family protein [Gammaproteobacteria bacterium]|nr:DUF1456 family protein [Gammaproteobacteria bacterium]